MQGDVWHGRGKRFILPYCLVAVERLERFARDLTAVRGTRIPLFHRRLSMGCSWKKVWRWPARRQCRAEILLRVIPMSADVSTGILFASMPRRAGTFFCKYTPVFWAPRNRQGILVHGGLLSPYDAPASSLRRIWRIPRRVFQSFRRLLTE